MKTGAVGVAYSWLLKLMGTDQLEDTDSPSHSI